MILMANISGGMPPFAPWHQFVAGLASTVDRFIVQVPVLNGIVVGRFGGVESLVNRLFGEAPTTAQEYVSSLDTKSFPARHRRAEAIARRMIAGKPVLVLGIDKVGKSAFVDDIANVKGVGNIFKIILNPVTREGQSRNDESVFEECFRKSLVNGIADEIEARGGTVAIEVLPYLKRSIKREDDVMAWLNRWLSDHGYSSAVVVVHEAILWKPEFLAKKLAGERRIFSVLEYHNYAANSSEIEKAFPHEDILSNEYYYIGFLDEVYLDKYIRRFHETNRGYVRPVGSQIVGYIYEATGGWLEAVNFILEEVCDPTKLPQGTKFPKEISIQDAAEAIKKFAIVEGGVKRLQKYLEKLDKELLTVLRAINRNNLKSGEFHRSVEDQLIDMGFIYVYRDGYLRVAGSMLESALQTPPVKPFLVPRRRPSLFVVK